MEDITPLSVVDDILRDLEVEYQNDILREDKNTLQTSANKVREDLNSIQDEAQALGAKVPQLHQALQSSEARSLSANQVLGEAQQYINNALHWAFVTRWYLVRVLAAASRLEQWTRTDLSDPHPIPPVHAFYSLPFPQFDTRMLEINQPQPRIIPLIYPERAEDSKFAPKHPRKRKVTRRR